MPAVARISDSGTGHGCHPPRQNCEGSGNVFVNGLGAHRVGDAWLPHTCGSDTHDAVLASGSSTVFVNGKALGRIGDSVSCGSAVASGSGNVFAGG